MKALYARSPCAQDPLSTLAYGSRPDPVALDGWTVVTVRAASINHHDLWTLRGSGVPPTRYPMILGTECAGLDPQGREVIVPGLVYRPEYQHAPALDPQRTMLGEHHQGTFAQYVAAPTHTLIPKPPKLTFEETACLCGTWLTAYRMLFTRSGLRPGDTVLVQGAGGGVATALIQLAHAAGVRVWATSRSELKLQAARKIGAHDVFLSGTALPEKVDAVMESVGESTWGHSVRALRPGGTIVVTGATTGALPPAHLGRVFTHELVIVGSTSGTLQEARSLVRFMQMTGLRPTIDSTYRFEDATTAFQRLLTGDVFGKLVLSW